MDIEYSHGMGGVSVSLVECNGANGRPFEGTTATGGATITQGFDALMRPQIVPLGDANGKFRIYLEKVDRYYYVQATAPDGFLFTSGVCNDDVPGWECDYSLMIEDATPVDGRRSLQSVTQNATSSGVPLGISSGRADKCVFVDRFGVVEASINFGIMKVGDTQGLETNVALVLDFDADASEGSAAEPGRHLKEALRRATVIDEHDDGITVTTRYLLGKRDKAAIGTVTAEILASTLDGRLNAAGVTLETVEPKDVILSGSRPSNDASASATAQLNQLAVAMEIKGHYSPPPDLDFDYIVEDSINKDTATIRRGLREYNSNCRDQTSKVQSQGMKESDFGAIVSNSGAARPGRGGSGPVNGGEMESMSNVFSTACQSDFLVPDYFESSLSEIVARKVSDIKFGDRDEILFVAQEARSGIDSWAMGPIAAIAGLIILLMGAFVFRRALGPRRVDKYTDGLKTKDVDKEEMRRFGEAGGDMDDGSVDSAFYSESDSDIDLEETEKERKMRRKRKMKGNDQRKNGKSSSGKSTRDKLAMSRGSDDTENSNSSEELIEKSRSKKRAAANKSMRKLKSSLTASYKSDAPKARSMKKSKSFEVTDRSDAPKARSMKKSKSSMAVTDRSDAAKERSMKKSKSSMAVADRSDAAKERSMKKSKSSMAVSERTDRPRRGRSKRSGGDNANVSVHSNGSDASIV